MITIVAHTPTGGLRRMLDALVTGASRVEGIAVRHVEALEATTADMVDNGLTLLLTPANFGYMSGALKHAFDVTFRELEVTSAGHPYLAVVKGSSDTTGAVRAIEAITRGMGWRAVRPAITIVGDVTDEHVSELAELGEGLATALEMGAL